MLQQPTTLTEYEYSQTLDFALEYKHEYCSFLMSPLAVKRDIAVTLLLRCMCVHSARARASVGICLGHNSYINAWISKLYDTVVVLGEEKCYLKFFLGRLKVKVTLEGHINELFLGYNSYIYA